MKAPHRLDTIFAALADPTRRAILARLASGEASVTELTEPFAMSQPAVSKHLKVLERAGLVSRGRDAQRRPAGSSPSDSAKPPSGSSATAGCGRGTTSASTRCSTSSRPNRQHREMTDEQPESLKLATPGERDLVMTRVFDAPARWYSTHTKPELVGAGCWDRRLVHAGVRDRPASGRQVPLRVAARS